MRRLRSVFFWLHLAAGLLCGVVIAIMAFTGAVLAFEHEIVAWAERDVRRVEAPAAGAAALPLDGLIARAREAAADPEAESLPRVAGVTISSDPRDAIAVNLGREAGVYYVNQYTGEVRAPSAARTRGFMQLMEDWHRRLARTEALRETGRTVTGVANTAFFFLALSGLWLWWPRKWNLRALKPSLWFAGARGKARDWNWHNVYGFWLLPVLVVLTATGMVISYRWAGDLAYRLVGETPPAGPGAAGAPAQEFKIERPEGAKKLDYAAVLARLQAEAPGWTEITLREGLPQRRGAPGATPPAGSAGVPPASAPATPASAAASAPAPSADRPVGERRGNGGGRGPQPYSATLKADDEGPAFVPAQIVLHPFTGEVLSRSGYAEQTTGRKIRTWLRYLHTGQAFGGFGQLIAGLACLGGCVLVYTGFALSWRRFFNRRQPAS